MADKVRVVAWLDKDLVAKVDAARRELSMTRTAYIALAVASNVRRWRSVITNKAIAAVWPSGWPKDAVCIRCKEMGHDPVDHYTAGYTIPGYEFDKIAEYQAMALKKQKPANER